MEFNRKAITASEATTVQVAQKQKDKITKLQALLTSFSSGH
jgi:hypothetical protein